MGQATSAPISRGANGPSSRRISRYLRRGESAGDDDGGPHTQEELEAPTPGPHACTPSGHPHLDDHPHLAQSHRLVRAHYPQPQQAPATTEASEATGCHRSAKEDRMGSTAMAQSAEAALHPAAASGKASGSAGQEEPAPPALAQVQETSPATPAATCCPAQPLEQSGECVLDLASPAPTSSSAASTTIAAATQPMEQPGERVLDSPSTPSPASTATAPSVPPITTLESLQSALASSHSATSPDSVAPTIAPTLSSPSLPSLPPQQPLAPLPRPLPLGTTMIVQGLVQTIEVSRIPPRSTPATTNERSNPEQTSDKGKEKEADEAIRKEADETNGKDVASGSSPRSPSPISNTPDSNGRSDDAIPATLSNDSILGDTPVTATTPSESTLTTPRTTPRSSTSPSSTEVLGLLLSIAAQATAEALVPWSVPPRSRSTPREGIASGLAAAFSALAGSGAGVTATNGTPGSGTTVSEPAPLPRSITHPPAPRPPESRSSSGTPRGFSRLSPGRISSLSSRRISSFIPGRRSESTRRVSSPIPTHRPTSPISRRASSVPDPKPPRRGVLGRIERLVPRRLRRGSQAGPSRRTSSPDDVDFRRAPPPSSLPVSALPESSVSPLPSPGLPVESPMMPVPAPSSALPIPPPTLPVPPLPPTSALPIPPPTSTLPIPPAPTLSSTPTTDAEDLIRFSQMLGFMPGVVHPPGTFERFLSDMQDELRVALGEYQERVRSRVGVERGESVERNESAAEGNESATGGEGNAPGEGNASGESDATRTAALLDYTRPHVPSTDPLPLNWWRMYRFPALGDSTGSAPTPTVPAETTTSSGEAAVSPGQTTVSPDGNASATDGTSTPARTDTDSQPIHPAIIIGLRSMSRDPTEESSPAESEGVRSSEGDRTSSEGNRARSSESERVRSTESDRARSSEGGRVRSESGDRVRDRVRRRLRLGEEEERRTRDGTRNYIIWIIGGYYPSNHPLLAHPNLFIGQTHPDELWMLNELLGPVKPPTATREDIDKAGLRIVKGVDVKELAASASVTENCTERCLVCLDDYADEDDLRIMNCKHMFHKDCVDRWMETGRNNCPACRTKGVDTNSAIESPAPPESSPTPVI